MTNEEKISELGISLTKVEERTKSNTKRIDELEENSKKQIDLLVSINDLASEIKHMREDFEKTTLRIDRLENKDADTWNKFKWLIVTTLITIVLGFIAVEVGLK